MDRTRKYMDLLEKQNLIARISTGITIAKFLDKRYYIYPPSSLLIQESFDYSSSLAEDLKFDNFITDEDIKYYLTDVGLINDKFDDEIKKLNEHEEELKLEAYKQRINPPKVKMLKTSITSINRKIITMLSNKHSMDHLTLKGYVEICRNNYVLMKSIRNAEGRRININNNAILCDSIIRTQASSVLNTEVLRELARTDPWRSIWNASKDHYPFGNTVVEATDNQKNLCSYSGMYDNIYKHPDCPNDAVISDNVLLDGWMIFERRKSEQEKNDAGKDEHNGAHEVFLMAENKEHKEQIDKMNSIHAKQIKSQRESIIKSKGKIKESDLPDQKAELHQKAVEVYNAAMKR